MRPTGQPNPKCPPPGRRRALRPSCGCFQIAQGNLVSVRALHRVFPCLPDALAACLQLDARHPERPRSQATVTFHSQSESAATRQRMNPFPPAVASTRRSPLMHFRASQSSSRRRASRTRICIHPARFPPSLSSPLKCIERIANRNTPCPRRAPGRLKSSRPRNRTGQARLHPARIGLDVISCRAFCFTITSSTSSTRAALRRPRCTIFGRNPRRPCSR